MAHFDAIEPDRMLAVGRGDRIVELDHLLDAHPLTRLPQHRRAVEKQVSPEVAVERLVHACPVVVVVDAGVLVVLLGGCAESVIAKRLDPGLRIRPGEGRVVSSHPDPVVAVLAARRILDVVANVERVVDAGAQLFVEMASVVDAAAHPGNVERVGAGAPGRHIGGERHAGAIEDVRPAAEEVREGGFIEPFDEDHGRVGLDAHVSRIEGSDSGPGIRDGHGDAGRGRDVAGGITGHGREGVAAVGGAGGIPGHGVG